MTTYEHDRATVLQRHDARESAYARHALDQALEATDPDNRAFWEAEARTWQDSAALYYWQTRECFGRD